MNVESLVEELEDIEEELANAAALYDQERPRTTIVLLKDVVDRISELAYRLENPPNVVGIAVAKVVCEADPEKYL